MYYIYGLYLEGEDEIRYVGSTKHKPVERYWGHMNEPKTRGGAKNDWIKGNPGRVKIKVLQTVEDDPKGAERKMIKSLQKQGHRLFNVYEPRRLSRSEKRDGMIAWFEKNQD